MAKSYVEAGSQIILTNTFGANRIRLREVGAAEKIVQINRSGVEISRQAAAGCAKVFASMGPSGKFLLNGDVSQEELRNTFEEQAQTLAEAGAEGLVVETMSDLDEARLAVAAAHETGLPVIACMVFDSGRDKDRTMMGQTPQEAARVLTEAGADVIGANCGQGIGGFVAVCRRLRSVSNHPIWIKPNAGLPTVHEGKPQYHVKPDEFAAFVPELIAAGANFIGGCCGTSPEFVAAMARRRESDASGQFSI